MPAVSDAPRHAIVVRPTAEDIDELNHVSNLVYVRWVLEVARAHSDVVGWDTAAYRELGSIWVVRRHEIDYAQSARLGDEVVLTTWVDSWKRVSSVRRTELVRRSDDRVLARAATTWAFVELESGRPTRIPASVQEAFSP